MDEIANLVERHILPHWPFFAALLIFMMVGQIMNRAIFTRSHARELRPTWVWIWGRKTLALQPIIAGALLGTVWRDPERYVDTLPESMGYFAMAGALSVWAYETLKGLAKSRGYVLSIPGLSERPPAIALEHREKTATLLYERVTSGGAHQRVYRLSEPLAGSDYVVVSSCVESARPEVMIFRADADGTIIDYDQIDGYYSSLDHTQILQEHGYRVLTSSSTKEGE